MIFNAHNKTVFFLYTKTPFKTIQFYAVLHTKLDSNIPKLLLSHLPLHLRIHVLDSVNISAKVSNFDSSTVTIQFCVFISLTRSLKLILLLTLCKLCINNTNLAQVMSIYPLKYPLFILYSSIYIQSFAAI